VVPGSREKLAQSAAVNAMAGAEKKAAAEIHFFLLNGEGAELSFQL
jgi:hypothetical protein